MPVKPKFPLQIFYDGACSVCASEIEYYGRMNHAGRLLMVDISASDFDPETYGVTLAEFMYHLHAIDHNGKIYCGVEAFWAIWQAFPKSTLFGFMGRMIMLPGINLVARICYKGFARIRKYLPKRTANCATGSCRIGKDKPG
jgi:predicted DCC family thiol-disulfide oxidoreductase YuxK